MEKEVHWIVYLLMLIVAISIFVILSSYEQEMPTGEVVKVEPKAVSATAQVSLTILDRDEAETGIQQEP